MRCGAGSASQYGLPGVGEDRRGMLVARRRASLDVGGERLRWRTASLEGARHAPVGLEPVGSARGVVDRAPDDRVAKPIAVRRGLAHEARAQDLLERGEPGRALEAARFDRELGIERVVERGRPLGQGTTVV